jgi:type I restriction enzyme S subunit
MRKYPKYKDSGVEWIGEIPEEWNISRVGRHFQMGRGRVISNEEIVDNVGEYPVYSSQTENNGEFGRINTFDFDGEFVTWTTDGANAGTCFYRSGKFNTTNVCGMLSLRTTPYNLKYLNYFLNCGTRPYVRLDINPKLMNNMMSQIPLILFSLPEQLQIVQFLDQKTSLIDTLIEKKLRKIELLKEQRISVINQTVTKGLNPNVKMKDSGVEWIGEIPEHWGIVGFTKSIRIRHGYQFRDYDFTDYGIKVVKITQLDREGFLNISDCSFIDESRLNEFLDILINEDDILMCLTGGTIGKIIKVGKVGEPLVQNYRVGHFSPLNEKILNDYIFCFMSSDFLINQIFYEIRETGQPNIGIDDFRKMKVLIPPIHEQYQIIDFIENKTSEIDTQINLENRKIDLLKEYRQSLISEVVTGKIDVRNN